MKLNKTIAILLSCTMLCSISITGCKKNETPNENIKVAKEYKSNEKITLKDGDNKVYIYMPNSDIEDENASSIIGTNFEDNGTEIPDVVSNYKDLQENGYKRIHVTFKDNSSLAYELFSNVKDVNTIFDEDSANTIENNGLEAKYITSEYTQDNTTYFLYTILISVTDTEKIIINAQATHQFDESDLFEYMSRISLK